MSNRELDEAEVRQLTRKSIEEVFDTIWPGEQNLSLIADAVNLKRDHVQLEPDGQRFTIKYHNNAKAVFIKPDSEEFVPCVWLGYDRLKEVIADAQT